MKTPIVLGLFAATAISALALACTVSPGVDGAEGVEEGDPAGPTTTTTPEEPATPVALPEEDAGASGTAPDARGGLAAGGPRPGGADAAEAVSRRASPRGVPIRDLTIGYLTIVLQPSRTSTFAPATLPVLISPQLVGHSVSFVGVPAGGSTS